MIEKNFTILVLLLLGVKLTNAEIKTKGGNCIKICKIKHCNRIFPKILNLGIPPTGLELWTVYQFSQPLILRVLLQFLKF